MCIVLIAVLLALAGAQSAVAGDDFATSLQASVEASWAEE